jgi:hypothetical protein
MGGVQVLLLLLVLLLLPLCYYFCYIIYFIINKYIIYLSLFFTVRLHAIVFTSRSIAVYIFGIVRPFEGTVMENILLTTTVLSFHLLADYVTKKHGSKDGSTTVRNTDNQTQDIQAVLRFYALYQFSALASHLVPSDNLMALGFNSLIAIQSSAFLMTLYRKSVITYVSHGLWYSLCLVISFYHIVRLIGTPMNYLKLSLVYTLRTKFHVSKYILWIAFSAASVPAVEQLVIKGMLASCPEAVLAVVQRVSVLRGMGVV